MRGVSDAFLAALRGPHTVVTRCDIYRLGQLLAEDVPLSDGTVTLDRNAEIRGRCDLTIADRDYVPLSADGLLAPFGNELRVSRGVRFPNGTTELVTLGQFRIQSVKVVDPLDAIRVTGLDLASVVRDARLEAPYAVADGTLWTDAITDLIDAAGHWTTDYPLTTSIVPSVLTAPAVTGNEQDDRWKLAVAWAAGIGYEAYFDVERLVLRAEPTFTGTPVWTVDEGADGVLLTVGTTWDRDKVYNRVIATGENPGAAAVYRGVATDDDPASPTYYYGSFGRVPMWYSSPLFNSDAQCEAAAAAALQRQLGKTLKVDFSAVPNPALEPGDLVTVRREGLGLDVDLLIDKVVIPLSATGSMTTDVRATDA